MTGIEMTKRCAEAMGIVWKCPIAETSTTWTIEGFAKHKNGLELHDGKVFNPLNDDAHAMALVKRFNLAVQSSVDGSLWGVHLPGPEHAAQSFDTDLNLAIVACVAKMKTSP